MWIIFLLTWPWPWSNDLGTQTWPRYCQTGRQTDRQADRQTRLKLLTILISGWQKTYLHKKMFLPQMCRNTDVDNLEIPFHTQWFSCRKSKLSVSTVTHKRSSKLVSSHSLVIASSTIFTLQYRSMQSFQGLRCKRIHVLLNFIINFDLWWFLFKTVRAFWEED